LAVDGSDDHSEEEELIATTATRQIVTSETQRNKGKDKVRIIEK